MTSTQQSPVMVDSSPPSHPFASPDYAMPMLSPTTSNRPASSASPRTNMPDQSNQPAPADPVEMATSSSEQVREGGDHEASASAANDIDDSSNSESNSESSTSTETPGTASTPRSSAQESAHQIPDSGSTSLDDPPADESPRAAERTLDPDHTDQAASSENASPAEPPAIPSPPIDIDVRVPESIPSWVQYTEDTSVPSEAELKEIENNKNELNAADPSAVEKHVFTDLEDPAYRPCKKIRLSWVIKGVRGTRDRPNRARIMYSPAALVDGKYWSISFFPRGNRSRTSLVAYVRCSTVAPELPTEDLQGSFKCYEGAPDTDLSKCEPILDLELKPPQKKEDEGESTPQDPPPEQEAKRNAPDERQEEEPTDDDSSMSGDDDNDDDEDDDDDDDLPVPPPPKPVKDFRVSAQLGLVVYNPAEPRTSYSISLAHQFYQHHTDFGWDNFVNNWEDIHRRKHGQRQALLRHDTLAVDAYIRIYEDPTQALFWHASTSEPQWDSKELAGVFPMGTKDLRHSPVTASLAAWSMLAPFRKCIQDVDAGLWRTDSGARPRPLIAQLQLMLFQMRHMKKEELYVHLDNVLYELTRPGEYYDNVAICWDVLRRSIEIETREDESVRQALDSIFGPREALRAHPKLPVKGVETFQEAANQAFGAVHFKAALPDVLCLTLDRQSFDSETRQWQMHHDRVQISEEIDMSRFDTNDDGRYTLYGLVVHDGTHGDRISGKFFSVLRTHGPGGKWLVFSDNEGNQIFSRTKKDIEKYEGLRDHELKKFASTRSTIHMALYIRSSRFADYLPGTLEPYRLPRWMKNCLGEAYHHDHDHFGPPDADDAEKAVPVEIFSDRSARGLHGKIDLYKLKSHPSAHQPEHWQQMTADRNATIADVRAKLAEVLAIDPKAFKLWCVNYGRLGEASKSRLGERNEHVDELTVSQCLNTSKHVSLWMSIIAGRHQLDEATVASNFLKIGGAHVAAAAKPEPVAEDEVDSRVPETTGDPAAQPDTETVTEATSRVEVSQVAEAASDAEQNAVREAVEQRVQAPPAEAPVASPEADPEPAPANEAVELDAPIAAADAEQESVREAVARDVCPAERPASAATAEVTEVDPRDPTPTVHANDAAPTDDARPEEPRSDAAARTASEMPPAPAPPTEGSANDTTSDQDPDVSETLATQVPPESPRSTAGHAEPADASLSNGQQPLPVVIPVSVSRDHITLLQVAGQDDMSAEDAALIQSMIAADLEAAEQARHAVNLHVTENEAGQVAGEARDESRPSTPKAAVGDIHGFLYVFDAEEQTLCVHGAFTVPQDMTVAAMVRTQMNYADGKSFQLWTRCGTYRTMGVSLESTFQDVNLRDFCDIIVGDQLGELKIEALKKEAKYVDPGKLMRYLSMLDREHPTAALTSEAAVELAEFGRDYYKGPLIRGQRHGASCIWVTKAGDQYDGPLVAGQKSGGQGTMVYQNGDVYTGDWLDDQKHGQGEFVEKRTGNRYVGGYENDKRWGKGITYWEQADQQAALCQVCYFEEVDALFYRCGHVVACYACARQCAADSQICPVCRKPIDSVVKMYRS